MKKRSFCKRNELHFKRYHRIKRFTTLSLSDSYFSHKIPLKTKRKIFKQYKIIRSLNNLNSYFYHPAAKKKKNAPKAAKKLLLAKKISDQNYPFLKGVFIRVGKTKGIKVTVKKTGFVIKEKNLKTEIFPVDKEEFQSFLIEYKAPIGSSRTIAIKEDAVNSVNDDPYRSFKNFLFKWINTIPKKYTEFQMLFEGNHEIFGMITRTLIVDEIINNIKQILGSNQAVKLFYGLKGYAFGKQASKRAYLKAKRVNNEARKKKNSRYRRGN